MRDQATSENGNFTVKVIAGTRAVLMAINCPEPKRKGLLGFSFYRQEKGAPTGRWLKAQKVFKTIVPNPKADASGNKPVITTDVHPVQDFTWSDYTAIPGTTYTLTIHPRYGAPEALTTDPKDVMKITIHTELEDDPNGHGIWFNRGAIAGQYFADRFKNHRPTTKELEDITNPQTQWLSRGLVEACLGFINSIPKGEGLRACFYEFTYQPIILALKDAVTRGVDVKIAYHGTPANKKAITKAGLPKTHLGKPVLFERTVPKIPHNKFMIRLQGGKPESVWTGSTNITPSGFLGQTNVGHKIKDDGVARSYLNYWAEIHKDPQTPDARAASTKISPHPAELVAKKSMTTVFSPRHTDKMLDWYANRMSDATDLIMFTAAFNVSEQFLQPLAKQRDFQRYILMEKRPSKELKATLRADTDVMISYGAVLGETTIYKDKKPKKIRIQKFGLDKWFEKEEHFRETGNIFYVHTKFLLIDPLSKDPLICTGSANFSKNSLTGNDENMLLIRGDERVADIYVTEFDRIFRHFFFRDVANEIEQKGGNAKGAFLELDDSWTPEFFQPGRYKMQRRQLFFGTPGAGWAVGAAQRPADETAQAGDTPSKRAKKPLAKKTTAKKAPKKTARKAVKKAIKKPAKKAAAKKAPVKKTATKKAAAKKKSKR